MMMVCRVLLQYRQAVAPVPNVQACASWSADV